MFSIGRIPGKLQSFFRPLRSLFRKPQWDHFQAIVLAMVALPLPRKIVHLLKARRQGRHRTNVANFLHRSPWDPVHALRRAALGVFFGLEPQEGEIVRVTYDDTKISKCAKVMAGVGKLFDPVKGVYAIGHTVLLTGLLFRGIFLPWRWDLYLKREFCEANARDPAVPRFMTLTEMVARSVRQLPVPRGMVVRVLFDSFYLCREVVRAVREMGYSFFSVAKSNRTVTVKGQRKRIGAYGERVLRRSGRRIRLPGRKWTARVTVRRGVMKGVGEVQVVFSRRQGERKFVAVVTSDLTMTAEEILSEYAERWSTELAFRDLKQHLGLGDYQLRSLRGVVTHLHLVAIAFVLLTHHAVKALGAQAKKKNSVLRIPTIQQLREDVRRLLWDDALHQLRSKVKSRGALKFIRELRMAA